MSQGDDRNQRGLQTGGQIVADPSVDTRTPRMYKVILLNDDFTPMEFVVLTLKRFFNKTEEQASEIMLSVHQKGSGLAGVFTYEVAEMKAMQANQFARSNQHPLKTIVEAES